MKRLIINADDFGWDADTVEATIALIERGWVTSATIMTGRQASGQAMDYARAAGAKASFGLHFNIVDGHAPCLAAPNSLVGADGLFRSSNAQRLSALFGRLRARDIAGELRGQLATLRDHGVRISHLDSHGHLHKFPAIARAIGPVLREFGVSKVRRPQNLYQRRSLMDALDAYCTLRFPAYAATDYFYMPEGGDPAWSSDLARFIPQGTAEIGVHPGRAEDWRRSETVAFFARDPQSLRDQGVALISYDQLN